jgi:pseudouridine-5'-phosphate glycosidase
MWIILQRLRRSYVFPTLSSLWLKKIKFVVPDAQWQLDMQNGALIAVPIAEKYESAGEQIQQYVNQAVIESEQNGINKSGNDATPWLLNRIAQLSGGNSLTSNIALLKNTALVGSSNFQIRRQ